MFALIAYGLRIARWSTAVTFGLAVLSAVLGVLMTFLVGRVVGAVPGVLANDPRGLSITAFGWLVAALLAVFVVETSLPTFRQPAEFAMAGQAARANAVGITEPLLRPLGVAHLEDTEIQDEQERAKGKGGFQVAIGLRMLPQLVTSRLRLIGSAVLVGQLYSWPMALVLAAMTLLMEAYRVRVVEREVDSWWGNTEGQRRASYIFDLGMRDAPKEVRVFGLQGWLTARHESEWLSAMEPIWQARLRGVWSTILVSLVHLGALGGAIVLVGRSATTGDLPLASVATVVPAILAIGMSYNGFSAAQAKRALTSLRAMQDLPAMIQRTHPGPTARDVPALAAAGTSSAALTSPVDAADAADADASQPARHVAPVEPGLSGLAVKDAIRFENVSFRYPKSDRDVLSGLNLELPAGRSLALVGINGAGKSTLVKLLAGAYPPTEGRITVDGVDLRELDLAAWQRQVAAIVQDFARFPLTATDNILLGAAEQGADPERVREVARQAGIETVIEKLPSGWDTILDKTYDGGVDLSGGEWQRVALARALFAVGSGSSVLVLDEPAAAMDVRAEIELVERYLDLTSGVTSLIISHRFSVVRDAHAICVLDRGGIVEQGTHDQLLGADGYYARMFRLQAERYARTGSIDDPLDESHVLEGN